mmetsp:Transcript_3383/g.11357  ORF Transcript_3383/g.11357 Transcript_3383/m.11357 type:complete len:235 (+) Transcript_3383:903-1607(+)
MHPPSRARARCAPRLTTTTPAAPRRPGPATPRRAARARRPPRARSARAARATARARSNLPSQGRLPPRPEQCLVELVPARAPLPRGASQCGAPPRNGCCGRALSGLPRAPCGWASASRSAGRLPTAPPHEMRMRRRGQAERTTRPGGSRCAAKSPPCPKAKRQTLRQPWPAPPAPPERAPPRPGQRPRRSPRTRRQAALSRGAQPPHGEAARAQRAPRGWPRGSAHSDRIRARG